MLQGQDYRSSDKVFSVVAKLIDRCTECKKMEPMTRVHTRYSEVFAD